MASRLLQRTPCAVTLGMVLVFLVLAIPAHAAECTGDLAALTGTVGEQPVPEDLVVDKPCRVTGTTYRFGHVNIVSGGKLIFIEPKASDASPTQDFWATSIIIENGGALLAGVDDQAPYGTNGKTLVIHLYGKDRRQAPTDNEGPGESCVPIVDKANFGDCGIPLKLPGSEQKVWQSNGDAQIPLPGGVKDYFYQYGNLHGDSGTDPSTGQAGHFGYKVLALSYGGTLRLRGLKGTSLTSAADIAAMLKDPNTLTDKDAAVVTNSGADWGRLAGIDKATGKLTLDRSVADNWKPGDQIVVTSTDYFPEHSEVLTIKAPSQGDAANVVRVGGPINYDHAATAFDVGSKIGASAFRTAIEKVDGKNPALLTRAETRAAVALLTRSIRIVSEGDTAYETFDQATARNPQYMYGGHVVFRQGFQQLQIQGVEFRQLGQGGLMGRYPVHFHIARRVPADTYVIDSSINESMTRWVVIHSTLGATIARNVGYKSIGHGYFLEDATETDNKFYANIGIYARAAVVSADNPRNIPGLLEAPNRPEFLPLKYHSDVQYPSVFWITNGWNVFAGNMAAGAGTCGACYWYVPAGNHDFMDIPPGNGSMMTPMKWSGYSAIQAAPFSPSDPKSGSGSNQRAGLSPVSVFYMNYCSTAQHSLSVTDGSPCTQVQQGNVKAVPNPRNPAAPPDNPQGDGAESVASRMMYPRYAGNRLPAYCDPSTSGKADSCDVAECKFGDPKLCVPSVFSHYTSSFNWAQTNFSAIWLRSSFLLLDHAFLSDVQGPGVTIVTGGDYTRSNLPMGYWGLTTNSIFVGATQPNNPYATPKGPTSCTNVGNVCFDAASGIGFPLANFGTSQRMYNVYDGPAYEDADAFLDVKPSPCKDRSTCIYFGTLGVRKAGADMGNDIKKGDGFLPNAAIGWKQSNGFYYPPAFHSRNLFFSNVDIRHYVIEPLTFPGTYRTDVSLMDQQYVGSPGNTAFFRNWSDVDRQTELSDDDGSLTGLIGDTKSLSNFTGTISVNEDPFFAAPSQTAECRSNVGVDASNACAGQTPPNPPTARTSPYDHVTAALYPDSPGGGPGAPWAVDCTNENCTGVPIYRQYLTGVKGDAATSTREWARWMANKCDDQYKNLVGKTRTLLNYDPYKTPTPVPPPNGSTVPMSPLNPGADPTAVAFWRFDTTCPAPFVRMAGMALLNGQRSVLTVNNGRYYIETNRSMGLQTKDYSLVPDAPRFTSVFEAGKSYNLFFLFAKKTTRQTYQIYVGPGFKLDNVTGVRVPLEAMAQQPWPTWPNFRAAWNPHLDKDNPEILDIDVDFSKIPASDGNLDPEALKPDLSYMDDTCQPHTYCTKVGGGGKTTCACDPKKLGVLGLLNPNYKAVCDNVCEHWAVEDIDCPKQGCFGFKFALPADFAKSYDKFARPMPLAYPSDTTNKTPWDAISLQPTTTLPDKAANTGGCYYPAIPSDKPGSKCKVAD